MVRSFHSRKITIISTAASTADASTGVSFIRDVLIVEADDEDALTVSPWSFPGQDDSYGLQ